MEKMILKAIASFLFLGLVVVRVYLWFKFRHGPETRWFLIRAVLFGLVFVAMLTGLWCPYDYALPVAVMILLIFMAVSAFIPAKRPSSSQ